MIVALGDRSPRIGGGVFLAPSAQVIGDVRVGARSSIWYGAVVRGDMSTIAIGERTNVQDLACLHVDEEHGLVIGDDVTVGHRAVVHGSTVRDRVLIGMGAIVLNGAEIGEDTIVAAGAIVTEGMKVPARSLVVGVPGKVRRELTSEEISAIGQNASHYCDTASRYIEAGLSGGGSSHE